MVIHFLRGGKRLTSTYGPAQQFTICKIWKFDGSLPLKDELNFDLKMEIIIQYPVNIVVLV